MTTEGINQLLNSVDAAQQAGQPEVATKHYHAVIAIAPKHRGALDSLGIIALGAGDFRKAIEHHARAAAADPAASLANAV